MSKSIINFVGALIAAIGIAAADPASAGGPPVGGAGTVRHVTIWVPDYFGHNVFVYKLVYTGHQPTITQEVLKALPKSKSGAQCWPNAVAVLNTDLYIVCNSGNGGPDEVLVYSTTTLSYKKRITGIATDGMNYFTGSQLIAILFDSHNNLWLSGNKTNDLLRVPSAELAKTSPKIDRQIIQSPSSPAGLAMDPSDHSLWVVGQSYGGIVVSFPDNVLNGSGTHLGNTALNPPTAFCMSNSAPGCQQTPNLFNSPEGVAVFDNAIWVSNNGGNAPASTIVRLQKVKGELTATTFGGTASKPFACPGGMFAAPVPSGGHASLWVNDEGYDVPNTDCGSSNSDTGNHIGRVLQFLADDLLQHQASPRPEQFTYWNRITTSSPGFGGIFVQWQ